MRSGSVRGRVDFPFKGLFQEVRVRLGVELFRYGKQPASDFYLEASKSSKG